MINLYSTVNYIIHITIQFNTTHYHIVELFLQQYSTVFHSKISSILQWNTGYYIVTDETILAKNKSVCTI